MPEILANYQIVEAFEDIVKDKSLDPKLVLETLKQALIAAVRKKYGTADNVIVTIDLQLGAIKLVAQRQVVMKASNPALEIEKREARKINPEAKVGDTIEVELNLMEFGRNAIMTAKQNLIQRIKDSEREMVFADYRHKVGEIISGSVQRIERGSVIINLGRAEGIIPRSEQIAGEHLPLGKTIRSYVKDVKKDSGGPQVILSRKAAEFVKKLFEFEVPEIYEGRVQIITVSREAGERTKVAVYSSDDRIDPVGACVGLKGTRVQGVVKELSNEKIDIIPYSPDPEQFIRKAIAPAEVTDTYIHADEHKIVVIVPDSQLSLAIGKGGVNARLAARLVGWRLTIYGEEQYKTAAIPISTVEFLTTEQMDALAKYDIETVQKLARMKTELLRSIPEIGDSAEQILNDTRKLADSIEEQKAFVTKDKKLDTSLGTAETFAKIESKLQENRENDRD